MTTKQSVLMHRIPATRSQPDREFFGEELDEPGLTRQIQVSHSDWADMGSPEVITVTIEPGDLLNNDAS